MNRMHPLTKCVSTSGGKENRVDPLSKHSRRSYSLLPSPLFILPSFYLSDSHNIVPPLRRELICRNIPAAHCDHPVNTPIILSASASPSHPAEEMTPRGWQFNLPVTDGSYHGSTRLASPFLLTFIFTCQERDAARARPAVHPSRLRRRLLSSSSLPVLWGEMLPLVYVTLSVPRLHIHALLPCGFIKHIIPPSPPLLFSSPCSS